MIYRFGQFTMDTNGLELKAGASQITTEPQAFLLLQYLIENRDRVVSKDDIIAAVWDGRIVSDAALTYAVKAARRAVGDDGRRQAVIRTLPRRGFRFVTDVIEEAVSDREPAALPRRPELSDIPSIAVLPFENMSGDPDRIILATAWRKTSLRI